MTSIFYLALVACLVVRPIREYLWSLIFPSEETQRHSDASTATDELEVDGGVWEQETVFECIEKGLRVNPDEPALICMNQPAHHLAGLVSGTVKVETIREPKLNGLWPRQQDIKADPYYSSPKQNGYLSSFEKTNGVRESPAEHAHALWSNDKQHKLNGVNGVESNNHNATGGNIHNSSTSMPNDYLTLTYRQLHSTALKLAAGLLESGARPDTTMVMAVPNGGEYAILLWACVLLRITYVSIDPGLLEISGFTSLKYMLRTLRPQIVVAPDASRGKAFEVAMSELQLAPPIRVCLSGPENSGWLSLSSTAGKAQANAERDQSLVSAARRDRPSRIHSVMFTSGTSGQPKGCPQRVSGMAHALRSQAWLLDGQAASRALMQPHNSRGIAPAQTLQTWNAGGTVVMTGQVFDAHAALDAISHLRATFLVLTPAMVHDVADALQARQPGGVDLGCVHTVQVGGDAITRGLLERCAVLFPRARICVNHGMTEGPGAFLWPSRFISAQETAPRLSFYAGEISPAGAVAPGARVRIWDAEEGRVVGRGEPGELHVSCPSIIHHYWGGRSEESFSEDDRQRRWFKSGDIAVVDENGLVFVLGRKKDIIRRAGVKIMPAVIESVLEAFIGTQTVVVPVHHHVLGAEPFAIFSSYNGKSQNQIKDHIRKTLGKGYALGGAASLEQLGLYGFPLNSTHKVDRAQIQVAVDSFTKGRAGTK
ncbi:hypothetical protein J7T55_015277 [Diaporthe amygdali]|uniref:uncharacterized protein n=1 Tax=Phomopsis amygdali TaxID=1214568 RepID=UPI0022FE5D36|nr:uncharacterized protein J7T55_015277 [Diaporthe amygdali]KAJ0120548.1 hypothetical protein J7T55_015277 [Diaporthe amygdali]